MSKHVCGFLDLRLLVAKNQQDHLEDELSNPLIKNLDCYASE